MSIKLMVNQEDKAYRAATDPSPTEFPQAAFDYKGWRENFLRIILYAAVVFGLPAVIAGVLGSDSLVFGSIYAATYVILLAVTFLSVPYWLRANVLLFLLFTLSVSGLLETGIWGDSRVFGLAFITFAALLLSPKAGWITLGITMISFLAAGWFTVTGQYVLPTEDVIGGAANIWISGGTTVLLLAVILVSGIKLLQDGFEKAQERAANAFMALRAQQANLENRVHERTMELARRTQELETASNVARDASVAPNLDTLLIKAVNLIQEGFHLYHVSVFLNDDRNEYTVLRAATGEVGQKLLDDDTRLKIDEAGIVGHVAGAGHPRIALDVESDSAYVSTPLLPDSRSEMALPLVVNKRTVGVLDIQSDKRNAFDESSLRIMQTLADQLAVAIENARLVKRTQDTLDELSGIYQEQIRTAWKRQIKDSSSAFEYNGLEILPLKHDLPKDVLKQLEAGHAVDIKAEKKSNNAHSPSTLIVPLRLRGQLIGTVGLEKDDPNYEWSADEIAVIENAALQTVITLENARLLEDAQKRAAREQAISEIATKIGSFTDTETILRTTVNEIGQRIGGTRVIFELGSQEVDEQRSN